MNKKVLVLAGSPRKGGNSDILCDELMRGAESSGNHVEKVYIKDLKIGPCMACYGCRNTGKKGYGTNHRQPERLYRLSAGSPGKGDHLWCRGMAN